MSKLLVSACFGLSVICATGCAAGREHVYNNRTLQVQPAAPASHWVAIAVHDRREEVVTGDKGPDFVGLSRGGWGNPFDVTTASDAPLADDMAASVANSMQRAGYKVRVVQVAPGDQPAQAASKLQQAGAQRVLMLRLDKWKSDTYQNTALHYDVDLLVLDAKGHALAHAQQRGDDNLGGSFWNPGGHADNAVIEAFQRKFELLLNDHNVVQALQERSAADSGVPRS